MNKRNRKQFEKRIQANRLWLAEHPPMTRWDQMHGEAMALLNDPAILDTTLGPILHFIGETFLHGLWPYVHF